jgi:Transposase IS66 family/IS66 C-terminal element
MSFYEVTGSLGKILIKSCVSDVLWVSQYSTRAVLHQKLHIPFECIDQILVLLQLDFEFLDFAAHDGIVGSLTSPGNSKAVSYALAQWGSLEVYLKEPGIEIDNNLVENAIRPTALGKKNWLFLGDADAGERGAIIYSIIESCRRHAIEPYTYLHDLLRRLPSMRKSSD